MLFQDSVLLVHHCRLLLLQPIQRPTLVKVSHYYCTLHDIVLLRHYTVHVSIIKL